MKKIILTVAAVFALTFANAQDKKESSGGMGFSNGDLYLTGKAGFDSKKDYVDDSGDVLAKNDGFELSPGLGYFVSDNLAIEGQLIFNSRKLDNNTTGTERKDTGFGVGAGVRYYFTPASQFSVSVGGNVTYMSIKQETTTSLGSSDVTAKEIGFNIPVGLNYFVSNNFALTTTWAGFGYSSNDNGGNGAPKTSSFNLGVDLSSISFGLLYKL